MPSREHRVPVDNGTYTFLLLEGHSKIFVLRHGAAWHEQSEAHHAIHALMSELDAARVVVDVARRLVESWRAGAQARLERAIRNHDRLVSDRSPPSPWTGAQEEGAPHVPPPLDAHAQFLIDEHEQELRGVRRDLSFLTADEVRAMVHEATEVIADRQGLDEVSHAVRDGAQKFAGAVAERVLEEIEGRLSGGLSSDERELLTLLRGDPPLLQAVLGGARVGARTPAEDPHELLEVRMFALGRGYQDAAARIGRLIDPVPRSNPASREDRGRRKMMLVSDNPEELAEAICMTGTKNSILQAARRMAARTKGCVSVSQIVWQYHRAGCEDRSGEPPSAECADWTAGSGAEAEELRQGIERIASDEDLTSGQVRRALRDLLDRVDAGDSLAHLEDRRRTSDPPSEQTPGSTPGDAPIDRARCPKCRSTSGGDWSQCQGICPMPGSPHFQPGLIVHPGSTEKTQAEDPAAIPACSACGRPNARLNCQFEVRDERCDRPLCHHCVRRAVTDRILCPDHHRQIWHSITDQIEAAAERETRPAPGDRETSRTQVTETPDPSSTTRDAPAMPLQRALHLVAIYRAVHQAPEEFSTALSHALTTVERGTPLGAAHRAMIEQGIARESPGADALVALLRAVDDREAGRLTPGPGPGPRPVTGRTLRAFLFDLETNDRTGAFDREVVLRLPIDGEAYVGGLRTVRVEVECDEEPAIVLDGADGVAEEAEPCLVNERTMELRQIVRESLANLLQDLLVNFLQVDDENGLFAQKAWEACKDDAERRLVQNEKRRLVRNEIGALIIWLRDRKAMS